MSEPTPHRGSFRISGCVRAPVASTWLWRLFLLVGAPVVFFGVLESSLRLIGIGKPAVFFIPDDKPGFYRSNPNFTDLFLPAHFDIKPLNFRLRKHKDANSFRVFVLGESAVFGIPEPGFGFAAQLRAQLRARYPDRKIEVYNLGITAINSHVVYQIARQIVEFAPDLFVVYMGNNEVVGPYGPGSAYLAEMPALPVIRAGVWVRSTRTGQLLMKLLARLTGGVNRSLEWRGMRTFSRNTVRGDDPRLEKVYRNFSANLKDMVGLASRAGIKTVLSTVVANLKDCAPLASLHRVGLSEEDLKTWKTAFDEGMLAWNLGENATARDRFEKALKIDPEYADTYYLLGRLQEERGGGELARRHYLNALHWDALRFRPDPRINEIIRQVARDAGEAVLLVEAARELGSDLASTALPTGHEFLFEHVHFNWEGNYKMARLLAGKCAEGLSGQKEPPAGWLDATACADALGYTDYGRLGTLYDMADLTKVPPFTYQLNFGETQVRLKKEIELTRTRLMSANGLLAAAEKVEAALQRDPENLFLPIRLEEIEFKSADYGRALQLIDQAIALQPPSPELVKKRANILVFLERSGEAEEILLKSLKWDPYFLPACQVLGEIWAKTAQFPKGKRFFEDLLAKNPWSHYLRLTYADLLLRSGDRQAAELECRVVLQQDPGDEGVLERLIRLYGQTGRQEEALKLMLEASKYQPKNYDNNVRLAQIFEAKNDREKTVEFLEAVTESGPADANLHARLAYRLSELNRKGEMMVHLLKAKKAAESEGDPEFLRAIEGLIHLYGGPAG